MNQANVFQDFKKNFAALFLTFLAQYVLLQSYLHEMENGIVWKTFEIVIDA